MKKIMIAILTLCISLSLAAPAMASYEGHYFTDCEAYPVVEEAAALELVHGYGDGTFRPLDTVTRGEWYQMLFNAFGRTPHYDAYATESADAGWMLDTLQLMLGHELFVSNYDWRQVSISASASSGDYVARYEAVQLLLLAIS